MQPAIKRRCFSVVEQQKRRSTFIFAAIGKLFFMLWKNDQITSLVR